VSTRELVCRALRGEPIDWSAVTSSDARDTFMVAEAEGVHLLLADRLWRDRSAEPCPEFLCVQGEAMLRDHAVAEQIGRRELRNVLGALRHEGIRPLLFKGAALAFTHYPDPALRPHVDVDLLVRAHDVRMADEVFSRLGYTCSPCVTGELVRSGASDAAIEQYLVSSQIPYHKSDRYGFAHAFDLHWNVSIPREFARLLTFDELYADAVSLAPLDSAAQAVGPLHALMIACVHRVAHHQNDDRLIWLYDIHLLTEALGDNEVREFVRLTRAKGIAAICEQGLSLAHAAFHTRLPVDLITELRAEAAAGERSATYLRRDMRKIDVLWSDLAAADSWRERVRLVAGHVFPPPGYMYKVYRTKSRLALPFLYSRRVIGGASAWCRRGMPKT